MQISGSTLCFEARVAGACGGEGGVSGRGFCSERALDEHQVGQGKKRVQLGRVLGQASVTCLAVPEEVFDDVERDARRRRAVCALAFSNACVASP